MMNSKIVFKTMFTIGIMALCATAYAGREGNGGDFSSLQRGFIGNLAELVGPMPGLTQYSGMGVGHILSLLVDGTSDELVESTIFKIHGRREFV
jgi:hypothetical protein